jgi:hypothetical protein
LATSFPYRKPPVAQAIIQSDTDEILFVLDGDLEKRRHVVSGITTRAVLEETSMDVHSDWKALGSRHIRRAVDVESQTFLRDILSKDLLRRSVTVTNVTELRSIVLAGP